MNKNRILIVICFLIGAIGFSGCKDSLLEEITSLDVNRVFSPTGLDAKVVNKTGLKLNWKPVTGADSYTMEISENGDFSGTPAKTISGILDSQIPYTVTGLSGETSYYVRIKALGSGIEDSKWVSASFSTDAEQIFLPIDLTKLQAKSVTLNWPAGEPASSIVIMPGNITHSVTPSEIVAGEATIAGLTGETVYTAKLMSGAKVRGTISFTTLIDLGGAIAVSPTDDLGALIAAAVGGETFALLPGTYDVKADVIVSKSISLKGAKPTNKPIVNGMTIRVKGDAGLSLKDLILDGTGSNGNQAILYDEASTNVYGPLNIQDSEIKNYTKGLIYVNVKTLIESVTISGNLIHEIEGNGGDFIDFRQGLAKTFLFENNTVYNSALARDLFRMDPNGSTNFPGVLSVITIRNNTFNGVSNGSGNRFLYIRLASNQINFTKNIIANSGGYYTNQASTTITTMADNNYFNAPNFYGSTTTNAKNDTGAKTLLDPGFAAPATGNFKISNETLIENGIGDKRWR